MSFKTIIAAIIAATLACGAPKPAKADYAELMAGDKGTTLDMRVGVELAPKLNLFSINRTSVDYDNEVSYFGIVDLTYNLVDGLDLVMETQAVPGMGVVERAGLQYFTAVGDLSIFAVGTCSLQENPDGEFVLNIGYTPSITEDVKLTFGAEVVTNVGEQGHNFSEQRFRAGLKVDKYEFGAAVDMAEFGNEADLSYNIGGFARVTLD
ncbi:hypothetical protein KY349_00735 [Candidatus Woesearchaeota archaeon]|nr:hypothetical protein [Candidatus Woesearchaeota archaeon]